MKFIHLASLGCGRYKVDETPYSLVVPTVRRLWTHGYARVQSPVCTHISLRLLYCTINLTSRYNINRAKFAILNKLFNTKETFFNCVVGCLLVYSLLLWKYIINLVIEHCQNIFANLPLCCTYFWSISNFDLL